MLRHALLIVKERIVANLKAPWVHTCPRSPQRNHLAPSDEGLSSMQCRVKDSILGIPHNLLASIKRKLEKTWVRLTQPFSTIKTNLEKTLVWPLAFAWPCFTSTKLPLLNGLEAKLQRRHAITCQSSDVWHSSRDMYTTTIQQLYNNYTTTHTTTIQQLHIYSVSLAWKLQQQKETDYHYFWCVLPKNHKIRVVV